MNNGMLHLSEYIYRFKYDKLNNVLYINIKHVERGDVISWASVADVTQAQLKRTIPKEISKIILYFLKEVSPLAEKDLQMRTLYIDSLFVGLDILVTFALLLCGRTVITSSISIVTKLLILSPLLLSGGFVSSDFNVRIKDIYQSSGSKPDVKAYRIAMYKFQKMIDEVNLGKYDPQK